MTNVLHFAMFNYRPVFRDSRQNLRKTNVKAVRTSTCCSFVKFQKVDLFEYSSTMIVHVNCIDCMKSSCGEVENGCFCVSDHIPCSSMHPWAGIKTNYCRVLNWNRIAVNL